jgi:transcriptional regulator NrdR family protein
MVCPYCSSKTEVINSRRQKRSNQVWRRRKCLECSAIFTSHESIDLAASLRVKKEGELTPFVSDMLFTEVLLSLQDRKNYYTEARELTDTITQQLLRLPDSPVFTPELISKTASEVLKRFNRRAWHRFVVEHPSLQT